MFRKFYEQSKETEYEVEQPVSSNEISKLALKVLNEKAEAVDVYLEIVEVQDKGKEYSTVVVDQYLDDGSNLVYLIYSADYIDEMKWSILKDEIKKSYMKKYNVCDEDIFYISFCR
ncbi:hypothetical protein SUSAZ_07720 [Sulfolobus acidocaldarius SUSAZ]|nr:hypothetical protein SUSAZ_07720 [Sulfolobus acidocaldarius SUSAZ]